MKPVIYFDFDGTLADSMDLCVTQVRRTLEALGLPPVAKDMLMACNGPSYEEAAALLNVPEKMRRPFCQLRQSIEISIIDETQKLFEGVPDLLSSLYKKAELVLVSNGLGEYLHLSLKKFRLETTFKKVQPLIEGQTKSQTLKQLVLNDKPQKALMVGDRLTDILAGKHAGIPTLAAAYGFGNDKEYNQADARVESVAELKQYLLRFVL